MPKKAPKKMQWKYLGSEENTATDYDRDDPLPSSISTQNEEEEAEAETTDPCEEMKRKLDEYVARMAYKPSAPPKKMKHIVRTESLAKPRRFNIHDNVVFFSQTYEPKERADRMKTLDMASLRTLLPEEFEKIRAAEVDKKRKSAKIAKKKQKYFYELSAKLEKQSRTQYLNALLKKFAEFVADMAVTMNIPPQLNEPYARMQRGIFYNIVCSLGIQPQTQAAYYYNTQEAIQYDTIHKCSHAILCLIIKALDAAAMKNPDDIFPMDEAPKMDTYIRERLEAAAIKKLNNILAKSYVERNFVKPMDLPIEIIVWNYKFRADNLFLFFLIFSMLIYYY